MNKPFKFRYLFFSDGPFTILAPTNDAFDSIDASNLEEILANATELKSILRRHIIAAKVEAIDVDSGPLNTSGGEVRMSSRPILPVSTKETLGKIFKKILLLNSSLIVMFYMITKKLEKVL